MNPSKSASPRSRFTRLVGSCLALALFCSGCTSTRFVSTAGSTDLTTVIRAGDRVDCKLHDGTSKNFTVTAVEPSALVGDSLRLTIAEIAYIEVTAFDGKKTLKVVGGVVAVAGLTALVIASQGSFMTFKMPGLLPGR